MLTGFVLYGKLYNEALENQFYVQIRQLPGGAELVYGYALVGGALQLHTETMMRY